MEAETVIFKCLWGVTGGMEKTEMDSNITSKVKWAEPGGAVESEEAQGVYQ